MKLYNENSSPFSSRVRVQIYHKDIPVEICAPPGGLRTDAYRKLTGFGLVPALDIGGQIISESVAVMEYLEDSFPDNPMRPVSAQGRAQMRSIISFHDHKVQSALGELFRAFMSKSTDQAAIDASNEKLLQALTTLESAFTGKFVLGDDLSIADCAMIPSFYYITVLPRMMSVAPVADKLNRFPAWWELAGELPAVQRVLQEINEAVKAMMAGRQGQ